VSLLGFAGITLKAEEGFELNVLGLIWGWISAVAVAAADIGKR
jgi:hypothetical protein